MLFLETIRKDPHYTFALIEADKDDNKFVDCAIAANAKCIVLNVIWISGYRFMYWFWYITITA